MTALLRSVWASTGTGVTSSLLLLLLLLAHFAPTTVDATPLMYTVAAHEKACFYTWVDQVGRKVSFYFAVQSGGAFDIDYLVTDPKMRTLMTGHKERQGDYVFTANEIGEYTFCFSNEFSTFADKLVDFEIALENEHKPAAADAAALLGDADGEDHKSAMDDIIFKLFAHMNNISRHQKYFRTREHRNMYTVRSTEAKIYYFALLEGIMIVTVAALQVFMVRTFFNTTKRGNV